MPPTTSHVTPSITPQPRTHSDEILCISLCAAPRHPRRPAAGAERMLAAVSGSVHRLSGWPGARVVVI